jgi:hypothetical protein
MASHETNKSQEVKEERPMSRENSWRRMSPIRVMRSKRRGPMSRDNSERHMSLKRVKMSKRRGPMSRENL